MPPFKFIEDPTTVLDTESGSWVPISEPAVKHAIDNDEVLPSDPLPEPETPVASILLLMLADVTDVDETKPILEAMLYLLGG